MFFLNCSSGKPSPGLDMNRGVMMIPGCRVAPNPTQPKSKMGWRRSAFGAGRQRVGEDFLSAGCKWSNITTTLQFPPRSAHMHHPRPGMPFLLHSCLSKFHPSTYGRKATSSRKPSWISSLPTLASTLFSLKFHSLPLTPLRQLPQYLVVTWCSELNWVPSQKDMLKF